MQEIIDFLDELSANNDRTWFEANRERYKSIKQRMDSVAEEFIEAIAAFDSSIEGLRAKDCTYRIMKIPGVRIGHRVWFTVISPGYRV